MTRYGIPNIIVIVVNYNTGSWLRACVEALFDSCEMLAVCVVDNASTDNSIEILQESDSVPDRLEIIRNEHNLGFATANNQILTERTADYFVLVNPDCIVEKDTIGTIVGALETDKSIGLASCLIRNPDGSVQKTCRRTFPTPMSGMARAAGLDALLPGSFPDFDQGTEETKGGVEFVDAVSGAFMVARGSALDKVGNLDEGYFMHCEDLDWCKRFWQSGFKVAFVGDTEVTHIKGGSGRSLRVNWHLHQGMLRFYKKFYVHEYPKIVFGFVYIGVFLSLVLRSASILIRGRNGG